MRERGAQVEEELTLHVTIVTEATEKRAEALRNERETLTAARISLNELSNHSSDVFLAKHIKEKMSGVEKLFERPPDFSENIMASPMYFETGEST